MVNERSIKSSICSQMNNIEFTLVRNMRTSILSVALLLIIHASFNSNGEIIRFKLSATNLPNKDIDGRSDAFVKLFFTVNGRHFHKFGESVIVHNNPAPTWDETFAFDHKNGTNQIWKFMLIDWDFGWIADDHLGRAMVNVDDYVKTTQPVNGTVKPYEISLFHPAGGILKITPVSQ